MILFYSDFCQHCNVLLETIKRHDKNGMIKLVSIDMLRNLNKPIDKRIHSVPALLILNTKEYLFGKNVFDYLLLPNRGVLFSTQITNKGSKDDNAKDNTINSNNQQNPNEPMAFALGSISAEQFSSIDDDNNSLINDKNYNWDLISNDNTINTETTPKQNTEDSDRKKGLPTLEDIMKQRANDMI